MSLSKIRNARPSRTRKVHVTAIEADESPRASGAYPSSLAVGVGKYESGAEVRFAVDGRCAQAIRFALERGSKPVVRIADWQVVS